MRKDKKGQAAMEFLMTYGWAILAAIVVIGILGYSYFSSDVMNQRMGIINSPFYLNAHNVNTTGGGTINLEIENKDDRDFNITSIELSVDNPSSGTCEVTYSPNEQLDSGEMQVFAVGACTMTLESGDSFGGDISLGYREQGSGIDQYTTGQIRDTVI